METWDRYWNMESSSIEEYTGTEKAEKQMLDEKIMKRFKETILKRPDGYYVRLPWKEPHTHLPDNKRMAVARPKSLLRQYENRKEFLEEFDRIFQEQLQQGMIEEVTEELDRKIFKDKVVHCLAYQAVVTPE
ncbi:hypothetical protein ANCDUO_25923 [Ancylostoma duodenale]|uniref:Uncharacterized protein n=1 Tax=Ancylostoma duodenale TaxID=51022 RepID=A0A0C2BJV6_9BILA|nr:hypothetical protein ANCDUO_25923 [Ancylostoma duodenale]